MPEDEYVCHGCDSSYELLGGHWRQSGCEYPQPSPYQRDILIGLLMGDGSLNTENKYPRILTSMVKEEFLEWINQKLGVLSTQVTTSSWGAPENERCQRVYSLYTRGVPALEHFKSWYDSGQKRFPEDLNITSTIAKIWYCCDGGLKWTEDYSCSAMLYSGNESDRPEYLESLFQDVGFDVSVNGKNVYLGVENTKRFLKWIGSPPPGFDYKWCNHSRSEYEDLKDA